MSVGLFWIQLREEQDMERILIFWVKIIQIFIWNGFERCYELFLYCLYCGSIVDYCLLCIDVLFSQIVLEDFCLRIRRCCLLLKDILIMKFLSWKICWREFGIRYQWLVIFIFLNLNKVEFIKGIVIQFYFVCRY